VETTQRRLVIAAQRVTERRQARLTTAAAQLDALSPLATLARGYAVARTPDGATLSEVGAFSHGQAFELWVRDGVVAATVDSVKRRSSEPGNESAPDAE